MEIYDDSDGRLKKVPHLLAANRNYRQIHETFERRKPEMYCLVCFSSLNGDNTPPDFTLSLLQISDTAEAVEQEIQGLRELRKGKEEAERLLLEDKERGAALMRRLEA